MVNKLLNNKKEEIIEKTNEKKVNKNFYFSYITYINILIFYIFCLSINIVKYINIFLSFLFFLFKFLFNTDVNY